MHTATAPQLQKPTLQIGSTGPDVQELQELLLIYYPRFGTETVLPRLTNGVFDTETAFVVRQFQYQFFLKVDGIVGLKTWEALYRGRPIDRPVLQYGDSGDAVIIVQEILFSLGHYDEVIDGEFEVHTDAAVRSFQQASGIEPDGKVGQETWYGLSRHPRPGFRASEAAA